MSVRTSDGADLWVAIDGDGPPVVLCHGGPGLWDYLDDVAAMLADDFTVHRWDQRACGRSTAGAEPVSTDRTLRDLDELRAHLGHERWSVVGHSWGAEVALLYGLLHRAHTTGVVYISGRGTQRFWRDEGRDRYHAARARRTSTDDAARLEALASLDARAPEEEAEFRYLSWMTDLVSPEGNDALRRMVDAPFSINVQVNRLLAADQVVDDDELDALLRQADVPVLLLHGDHDTRPADGPAQLAALLSGARMQIIRDAGHLPWVEQPALVAAALRSFLLDAGS